MINKSNNHIEIEDAKDSEVVVNTKDYCTVVISVYADGEEIHSLEVEDWGNKTSLEVIK